MGVCGEEYDKPREAANSSDRKSETGDIQAAEATIASRWPRKSERAVARVDRDV